ncbi:hypothetical protein M9H77_29446 [Catharanthus roseus]|uniref:Uncharacterized protein n=1 Tax=Catharanthus roseus TaxID=4058 RepID=A0ACB9ZWD4_CATRO|nr:hypothetical protein M9H77_29446 [Catharanthus roseus]
MESSMVEESIKLHVIEEERRMEQGSFNEEQSIIESISTSLEKCEFENLMVNPLTCELALVDAHMFKCSSPCAYLEKQLLDIVVELNYLTMTLSCHMLISSLILLLLMVFPSCASMWRSFVESGFLSICGSAKAARLLTRKRKCVTSGIRALVEAMTKTIKDQVAGSDTTNVESLQQGRGREEQRDPVISKPMGKSKDLTASFESRLTLVEEGMGAVDTHMENLDQRVEGLEADIAETHEEVREALTKLGESNRVDLQALRDEFMVEVARL